MSITSFHIEGIQRKLKIAFAALDEWAVSGRLSNPKPIQERIEDHLHLPGDDPLVSTIVTHPFIISNYISHLTWSFGLEDFGEEWADRLRELSGVQDQIDLEDETIQWIRVRRFDPHDAYYFGLPFTCKDSLYAFWDDEPILLTLNCSKWKYEDFAEITTNSFKLLIGLKKLTN